MSSILRDIKELNWSLIDKNGNFRSVPIGILGKRNISKDRLEMLKSIVRLVKDTNIVCKETKLYVSDRDIKIRGVNEEMNMGSSASIPYNTTSAKIGYDRMKLSKYLGESIVRDIIYKCDDYNTLSGYMLKITNAYRKYCGDNIKIRDEIGLDLDRNIICSELSEEEFNKFIRVILPYLKSHMEEVSKSINKESIGYFNYLVSSPVLEGIDKERLEILKNITRLSKGSIEIE